ncbi:MAG: histidine phosphatase family protein [Proteobacteria bacterium]|nr:histidine phosphatase family protein [Pseudomonadota bacterium]
MVGHRDLYLLRHGELTNSSENLLNGQSDVKLSEKGFLETISWLHYFTDKDISLILSSDLKRTLNPAMFFSEKLCCSHLAFKELREIRAGKWEGKTYEEIMKLDGDYLKKRYEDPVNMPFPEGESLKDLKKRVMGTLKKFLKEKKNILLISHAGVIRVIVLTLLGLPLKNFFKLSIDYAGLSLIRLFDDGNNILVFHNRFSGRQEWQKE